MAKVIHKCPAGGIFGRDVDMYSECEECPVWDPCEVMTTGSEDNQTEIRIQRMKAIYKKYRGTGNEPLYFTYGIAIGVLITILISNM